MYHCPTQYELEKVNEITDYVLKNLSEFEPFVLSRSRDGVSVYIHFGRLPGGLNHKLRISNHNESQRYGYKWQIRIDGIPSPTEQKQWSRYFDNADHFIQAFTRYYRVVSVSENQ